VLKEFNLFFKSRYFMKKITSILVSMGITLLSIGSALSDTKETTSTEAVTYQNKTYGFSFTTPKNWQKQSGEIDSKIVLFMQNPISDSCSFQFHITVMPESFPAEAAINASLNAAKTDARYASAKARDDKGTRGWEIVEKGVKEGHQRILYQVYDAKNRHYNFTAAANTEKFEACRPVLRKIIDSIKFNG
jgi:hypothetical protein